MGGINPERIRPTLGLFVNQEFCRLAFKMSERFFNAQSQIEITVIRESRKDTFREDELLDVRNSIGECVALMEEMIKLVESHEKDIVSEETWHNSYFEIMYGKLLSMKEVAESIQDISNSDALIGHGRNGSLQISLWHEEQNHRFRTSSTQLLAEILQFFSVHIEFTNATNKINPKFIK